jgi:hypothetical protein
MITVELDLAVQQPPQEVPGELMVISFDSPAETVGIMKELDKPVAQDVRQILGRAACERQEVALETAKVGEKVQLPHGMYWPTLVGAETIYAMTQDRRRTACLLKPVRSGDSIIMNLKAER